ncbi:MAG: hypothetical protein ACK5ME_07085 [Parahaliea sp.]
MAEAIKSTTTKTSAPKRKTTTRKAPAKRKTAAKRTTTEKSTVRSTMRSVENRAAAVERDVRKAARKAEKSFDEAEKSAQKVAKRAQEAGRKAFLASLGFYGMAFDQAQEQFSILADRVEARRNQAADLYEELVKRGEKVEAEARDALDDIELPTLDSLTDRKTLEAKLEEARVRFAELKQSISRKAA